MLTYFYSVECNITCRHLYPYSCKLNGSNNIKNCNELTKTEMAMGLSGLRLSGEMNFFQEKPVNSQGILKRAVCQVTLRWRVGVKSVFIQTSSYRPILSISGVGTSTEIAKTVMFHICFHIMYCTHVSIL